MSERNGFINQTCVDQKHKVQTDELRDNVPVAGRNRQIFAELLTSAIKEERLALQRVMRRNRMTKIYLT
jgi:hypothetical protein